MTASTEVRNVIVIGSGPAGWTAALYAARSTLKPLVFEGSAPNLPGGQLMTTSEVENFPGFPEGVQGPELMEKFKAQAVRFGADVITDNISKVDFSERPFTLTSESGDTFKAHTVIISTGANAKLLGLDREKELIAAGAGVSACATCDGAFYKDANVAVVGGGDTAMEEALFLTRYAKKVTLLHRRGVFRASKIMLERAQNHPKIEILTPYVAEELITEKTSMGLMTREALKGVKIRNTEDDTTRELDVEGFFVAIGHKPTTDLFTGMLDMDDAGYLVTHDGSKTNIPGVFACGDVQDSIYRQAITAAGSGCKAAIDAERFLEAEGH